MTPLNEYQENSQFEQDISQFKMIMNWANKVKNWNPEPLRKEQALQDLMKILLRPIQAEHIRDAYLKPENKARGSLTFPEDFFSPYHLDLVYEIITKEERSSNIEFRKQHILNLATDIVLPTSWNSCSIVDMLGTIGNVNRYLGSFEQSSNHRVTLILPLKIGFVTGGNHSIIQGIINGDGEIIPDQVIDLEQLFDIISFNGENWVDLPTGTSCERPRYQEFGWVWEIARLMPKQSTANT